MLAVCARQSDGCGKGFLGFCNSITQNIHRDVDCRFTGWDGHGDTRLSGKVSGTGCSGGGAEGQVDVGLSLTGHRSDKVFALGAIGFGDGKSSE